MKAILVVDDDEMFRTVMKHHLQNMGFSVLENDSGLGVIEQIAYHKPVACLVDIYMDKKEGLETIQEILMLSEKPRVIAVSGDDLYLSFAQEFGVDAVLQKPITRDALHDMLEKLGVLPA